MADVAEHGSHPVPKHLLSAPHPPHAQPRHRCGVQLPHDYEDADGEQQYLPDALVSRRYFEPSDQGWEQRIRERMDARVEAR